MLSTFTVHIDTKLSGVGCRITSANLSAITRRVDTIYTHEFPVSLYHNMAHLVSYVECILRVSQRAILDLV